MTRRGMRRLAGAMVSIGALVVAGQGLIPGAGSKPVAAAPACGAVPAGSARCLGLFLHPVHRADAGGGPSGLTPADIRSAYDLPATGGAHRTVAVVDAFDDPNAEADLAAYRSTFGLPPCTVANGCFRKADETGGGHFPAPDAGWSQEIALDLDMVSAACPSCDILLVEANGDDMPSLGAAENTAAGAPGVVAVSDSFGSSEDPNELGWDAAYFTHPGIALVAASGDNGLGADYPASSPLVTAVGGTSLTPAPGTPRGWAETSWMHSGSGCSNYEPKPAWQTDGGCSNRMVADVAAVADPTTGVAVYDSFQQSQPWAVAGGTSAAAPIVASIYALAGNTRGLTGASRAYADPSALTNITSGPSNTLLCLAGYPCRPVPGYNGPTGLGTPWGLGAF